MARALPRVLWLLAAAAVSVGGPVSHAAAQDTEPHDVGEAVVVTPSGRRMDGGGSAAPFSLRLPDGAECPGDTAFEYWTVHGFMVPADVDVTGLEFSGLGPEPLAYGELGTFREPLFEEETTGSWAAVATAAAERKGQPGPIINIPTFSHAVYTPGQVPPGAYQLGIACVLDRAVGPVWTATIDVTADDHDEPAGFVWTVRESVRGDGNRGSPASVALAAGGAAVAAVAFAHRRRAPRSRTTRE